MASQAATRPEPPPRFQFNPGAARTAAMPPPRPVVPVRYLGGAPIVVRGVASGRAYRFATGNPVQSVDARDVDGLVRKGIFRRHA